MAAIPHPGQHRRFEQWLEQTGTVQTVLLVEGFGANGCDTKPLN